MKRLLILLLLAVALTACAAALAAPARAPAAVDEPATAELVCYTVTPVPSPTCPCPTPAGTPAPTATPSPIVPVKPPCWDPRLDQIGVTVERRNGQYELVAAWTTINGNWDDVVSCAKAWQKDTLGGDHNAFGRLETAGGAPIQETFALVWPSGGDTRLPEADGWANMPMTGHNWTPSLGPGGYSSFFFGADKFVGFDMPNNGHWSFFGVWRPKQTLHEYDRVIMGR